MFRKLSLQFRRPDGFLGKIISGLMKKGNRPVYENLIEYMEIKQGEKMLEIGYGPGLGIDLILTGFPSVSINGVDFSELMYKEASERNKKLIEGGRVKLQYGDFLEAAVDGKDFDRVYFTNVIYFWNDIQKPFEKIYSLLKKGGSVNFYMAGKDYLEKQMITNQETFNKYSIEQVKDTLTAAGFINIKWDFKKGYYIKAEK